VALVEEVASAELIPAAGVLPSRRDATPVAGQRAQRAEPPPSSFVASTEVAFEEVGRRFGGNMSEQSPIPWSPQPRIVPVSAAAARLKDFGMTPEIIYRSIEVGDSARQRVTQERYPRTYPGVTMWAETLSEWRSQMLKRRIGYEIGRTNGYETLYSPDRAVAFTVVAGDSCTGIIGNRDPRLKRPKGIVTTKRVARNRRKSIRMGVQLALIPAPEKKLAPDEVCDTWFLIVRPTSSEVRLELSKPVIIDSEKIVSGYDERILFAPVPISGAVEPIDPDDLGDDGGDDLVGR
jgi:hypothetical protein